MKTFTGQALIGTAQPYEHSVACSACGKQVALRSMHKGDAGLAWLDPYRGKKGKYVCYTCLSPKRLQEIGGSNHGS